MFRYCNNIITLNKGFTIVELMVVLAIVGLLSVVALPAYQDYNKRIDLNTASTDIAAIALTITDFQLSNGALPASLESIGMNAKTDPWGEPYQYVNHDTAPPGHRRKDKFLVPVNSDYDLYSKGEDGNSAPAFSSVLSHDDIVRANDGKYIGLAEDY